MVGEDEKDVMGEAGEVSASAPELAVDALGVLPSEEEGNSETGVASKGRVDDIADHEDDGASDETTPFE